jgi:phospholipase/lecithinase/hemolysin
MAETGMNYTRAARELERRRMSAARRAGDSDELDSTLNHEARAQHAADQLAEQIANIQRVADQAAKVIGPIPDIGKLAGLIPDASKVAAFQEAADSAAFVVRFIPPF